MAALTITATDVIPQSDAVLEYGAASEAVAAGKSVYYDPATNKYGLYDANGATSVIRTLRGLCVGGAGAANQRVTVQTGGKVALGAVLTAGRVYVGGATPGDVAPAADITTGWYTSILGVAFSTTVLIVKPLNNGAAAS